MYRYLNHLLYLYELRIKIIQYLFIITCSDQNLKYRLGV